MKRLSTLLAIDTSTNALVIGIGQAKQVIVSHFSMAEKKHLERSTVIIEELMAKSNLEFSQLSAIVVGLGPGFLIGVRVGLVIAKTMAQVLNIHVIGISTLEVINAGFSKKLDKVVYPAAEGLISLGFERLEKNQVDSIFDLEPIYLKGPV